MSAPTPEIVAAAAYLEKAAAATVSASGLKVPEAETAFAAQRLRACAADLLAGMHLPDGEPE